VCERKCVEILVGNPEGKKALGRTRCRWEDNIKWMLQQIGGCGFDSHGSIYVQLNK
jgi:hypothetical protein